jgi:tetratricopeptide (TPR) repeat protein
VGSAPAPLITAIDARGLLSLDRLFEGSVWDLNRRDIGSFYATGWALSHYLLGTPGGRRELASFATQLESGTVWRRAYASAFGRPVEQLEAQLKGHVAMLSRGVAAEAIIDAAGIGASPPPTPVPLRIAEVAYELGYLALALHREGEDRSTGALARKLFEISLAEDPSAGRTEAALAEAQALNGDASASKSGAERALALAPDDSLVRLHIGRVELARAGSASKGRAGDEAALHAAEQQYRRALDLDPASALAWAGLGQTWRRAGRTDDAVGAFERARELGWSGQLDLELGGLYLELGRHEAALALLWPLAQDAHRGRASEDARELLERTGLLPDDDPTPP